MTKKTRFRVTSGSGFSRLSRHDGGSGNLIYRAGTSAEECEEQLGFTSVHLSLAGGRKCTVTGGTDPISRAGIWSGTGKRPTVRQVREGLIETNPRRGPIT